MDQKLFLRNSIPDRVRIVLEEKNIDYIYYILNKHLRLPIDTLKEQYQITMNTVRQELYIVGDQSRLAELFFYTQNHGLTYTSIEENKLRVDVILFINKLR